MLPNRCLLANGSPISSTNRSCKCHSALALIGKCYLLALGQRLIRIFLGRELTRMAADRNVVPSAARAGNGCWKRIRHAR
jgi:hypothetical protein